MALWEYKVITSGLHGFASPALLEAHLNSLAKDEWEIVIFQTQPTNPLAFNGLARRATVRDWSPPPETAVAAAPVAQATPAKAYEPPAKPVAAGPAKADEPATATTEDKAESGPARENTLRTFRDTERDTDPDAEDDDWDNWDESEDALPTFFEALKPHLRRNQKGVGMSVALDYLSKRWDQKEADLIGALKECGFTLPETEESDPDYFEFEGDLYWVNRNNRGQLFINTREKPRPVFRTAQAKKLDPNDPAAAELVAERAAEKAEIEKRKTEREERATRQAAAQAAAAAAKEAREPNQGPAVSDQDGGPEAPPKSDDSQPAGPLPAGQALLDRIRPLMRRNRRGPGYSGSVTFLARALKHSESDLGAALAALGLTPPANAADKPVYVEITDGVYWMNKDNRGGVWINGREKREGAGKPENGDGENADSAPRVEGTLTPTDVNASADGVAQTAEGAAPVVPETGSSPNEGNAAGEPSGQAESPSKFAASPSDAPTEGVPPAREVTPQTAAVDAPDSSSDSPANGETASANGSDDSGSKPKSARPRKPSTRPRTRKAKTDTDGSAPAVPESDVAADES